MVTQTRIEKYLAFFARKILKARKPFIIGVTGSIGKTSTRHAIACALSDTYNVREPEKNYNNQIGIPLTIIGAHGLEDSWPILGWLRVFLKAVVVWLLPVDYPEVLVLEYGIDHPNDMDGLLHIAKPEIAVLTTIGISHREFFNTEDEIAFEKGKLAASLKKSGIFVYNKADKHVADQTNRVKGKSLSYNVYGEGDISLRSAEEELSLKPRTFLSIQAGKQLINVTIQAVGTAHIEACVAAVAVAVAMKVPVAQLLSGLSRYRTVSGRLNVIPGIKKSILIDDSYNAAPLSTREALRLLERFPGKNKIAVLGDMLELGEDTAKAHKEIGELVGGMHLQQLITVGELGKLIAKAAIARGFSAERVVTFQNSDEAKRFVQSELEPDSVILIKGSQGVRMEKITKEVLAEPMSAHKVLPRQYGKWIR